MDFRPYISKGSAAAAHTHTHTHAERERERVREREMTECPQSESIKDDADTDPLSRLLAAVSRHARVACIRVDEIVPMKELALLTLIVTRRRPRNDNGNDNGNVSASATTNGQCGGARRPTSNDQSASSV